MIPEARRPTEVSHQKGLEQAIDHYKQSNSFLSLSENTRLAYTADIAQFQEYLRIQDISISEIESEDIRNWRDQLNQDGYAPATINRRASSLSSFLGWVRREGLFQADLTDVLARNKIEKSQPRTLTAEQEETLISKAKNLRDAALISIALETGARVTEIVNLNAEDVFSTKGEDHVVSFKGGVTTSKPRTLVIDKKIGDIITEYKEANGLKPEDPLFQGYTSSRNRLTGHRLTRIGVHLILNEYVYEIEVENLNSSMLRNTFIANFTGTPRQLAEVLGRRA